jgi:hypothetical protein
MRIYHRSRVGHQAKRLVFPRHVFMRCALDPVTRPALLHIPGVQRILEDGQGRFWMVAEKGLRSRQRLSVKGRGLPGPGNPGRSARADGLIRRVSDDGTRHRDGDHS